MRIRLDVHGRPVPPQTIKPQSTSSSPPSSPPHLPPSSPPPSPPTLAVPIPTLPLRPAPLTRSDDADVSIPPIVRTSTFRPIVPPAHQSTIPHPPPPLPPPSTRGRPPLSPASVTTTYASAAPTPTPSPPANSSTPVHTAPVDDERASDSGSSAATEAYNSEDEHGTRENDRSIQADVPMRTLRDRERTFTCELSEKGLRILEMRADGNCLFRALAHSVWADAERHAALRARVIEYLVQERDYFSQFVAEDFARYVRRKSRDGTHGNHLELQAAAEVFGRPIEVYSYSATPATIIDSWGTPANPAAGPPEPIRLSFHRGSHYNSVEPILTAPDKLAQKRAAAAASETDWCSIADARETEEEIERAVLALSLAESYADALPSCAGASSSSTTLPSNVRALIDSGYSEEQAQQAYRVAGHGGLSEMIRFLTIDSPQPKISSWGTGSRSDHPQAWATGRSSFESQNSNLDKGSESYNMTSELGSSSAAGSSETHANRKAE